MCAIDRIYFQDEQEAFKYLESVRWPDGPVCPHCGVVRHACACARIGRCRCADKGCCKDFTVRVATVLENSPIKLHKWLLAACLVCASKKGISSLQFAGAKSRPAEQRKTTKLKNTSPAFRDLDFFLFPQQVKRSNRTISMSRKTDWHDVPFGAVAARLH